MRLAPAFALAAALFAPSALSAEEVKDAIQEALKAYEAGDLAEAKFSLDTASQLIGAMRAKELAAVLPAAFDGWEAEDGSDADAAGMGAAMAIFGGGGASASREYVKTKGGETVSVMVILDSPMVMQFSGILANPQMAASMGKPVRFGRHRGVQMEGGEIQIVVANRALVTIDGSASVAEKLAYAEKIEFDKIASF